MRAIALTALLFSLTTAVQATPKTVQALQAANVPLTSSQERQLRTSTGQALADALGKLAQSSPNKAAAITAAVIPAHPEMAEPFVSALVKAAPEQFNDILKRAIAATPNKAAQLATLASELRPTGAGDKKSQGDKHGIGKPGHGNAGTGCNDNAASPS